MQVELSLGANSGCSHSLGGCLFIFASLARLLQRVLPRLPLQLFHLDLDLHLHTFFYFPADDQTARAPGTSKYR